MKRVILGAILALFLLVGTASAAPYYTLQGESINDGGTATTAVATDSNATPAGSNNYRAWSTDGYEYEWSNALQNASWARIRARSSQCNGVGATLTLSVGNAGTVYSAAIPNNSFNDYDTIPFVVDPSWVGSANIIVSVTQGNTSGCTRNLRLDKIDFYTWRPFGPFALSNQPAANVATKDSGPVTGSSSWQAQYQIDDGQTGVFVSGSPDDPNDSDRAGGKPLWQSVTGDPTETAYNRLGDQPDNSATYDGGEIPIPDGLQAATGDDGWLGVYSDDRHYGWSFYQCKIGSTTGLDGTPCNESNVTADVAPAGGYEASRTGKMDLTSNNSYVVCSSYPCAGAGRGSGLGLWSTVITGKDARYGLHHAVGCTISGSAVKNKYLSPPATKTDGTNASGVDEGSLFVLRSNYLTDHPTRKSGVNWTSGELNIIAGLQTYGCYITDRGGFELDTSVAGSAEQADWTASGVTEHSFDGSESGAAALAPSDFEKWTIASGQTERP